MSIGARIRNARKAKRLSQRHIAGLLGITPGAVSQWESGETVPSVERLDMLARLLEAEIGWLVAGPADDDPPARTAHPALRPVRVVGAVRESDWLPALEWPPERQFEIVVPVDPRFAGRSMTALLVQGGAAGGVYPDGTVLVVVPTEDLGAGFRFRPGDRIVARRRGTSGRFETMLAAFTAAAPNGGAEGGEVDPRIAALVIASYRPERAAGIP